MPTATPTAANPTQLPLSGEFVSQGATTTGTVSLTPATGADDEFELTLADFSTGGGDDLRIRLSTGELLRDADGHAYVDGSTLELEGKIDAAQSTQTFVYPVTYLDFGDIRSITVYDYGNRVALGSAALE